MKNIERTSYFPAHINPVHVGHYELEEQDGTVMLAHWNGAHWFVPYHAEGHEESEKGLLSEQAPRPWRGMSHRFVQGDRATTKTGEPAVVLDRRKGDQCAWQYRVKAPSARALWLSEDELEPEEPAEPPSSPVAGSDFA